MTRTPRMWLLLTTVLVWLCTEEVCSIKATSLIFGKTSITTTAASESAEAYKGVMESHASANNGIESTQNLTKLTGIPQVDYIHDPNLPRELNGYNLSEYSFYDGLPNDIAFKCDGLHDGFYASVPHKCQVYHHCLFGTRYDFLCANYTAFDQKTFICHFVSEVDCVNSKKFWYRNDALYKSASTTTPKPEIIPATSVPIVPILTRRPLGDLSGGDGHRRHPQRRRWPECYDYEDEDEFFEEPRRRKQPRYRARPVYDDEYEEDSYDRRRPSGRRDEDRERRLYNRRLNNNDKRRYEGEDDRPRKG